MRQSIILAVLVFYPFLGGLLAYAAGRKSDVWGNRLAGFVTVTEFLMMSILVVQLGIEAQKGAVLSLEIPEICGFGLSFTMDGFRLLYGAVTSFMWMMAAGLSREYLAHHSNQSRFYLFLLMTLGATMGVFLSADLITTFVFFEIMSFTSYVWVVQEETQPSVRAAATYLAVAVTGGLVMLMGLFLLYHALGTTVISELSRAAAAYENRPVLYAAGVCMLVGFGAKAGAFPLHIWLPKAHPVAPAPASALLSGILTKTGIFGILVISAELFLQDKSWGVLILTLGVLTMFGGALLAVFSVDLKRTLACSSMSQIGFILVAVGMQALPGAKRPLAVHGAMLHMVNHSLIKLVLFLAAGVIFMNTHALDLNAIRGFGRKKPLLKCIFAVGALSISGIPMFSGYISKTLIHESIVEYGGGLLMHGVEWIFLLSGGMTLAYMTKLFVAVFVERNDSQETQRRYDKQKRYMNKESAGVVTVSAAVLLVWGLLPHGWMDRAAELGQGLMHLEESGHTVAYFSVKNLSGALISIVIGTLVYLSVIRGLLMKPSKGKQKSYINAWPVWLDLENLVYRPVVLHFLPFISGVVCRVLDTLVDLIVVALRRSIYRDSPLPHERSEGNMLTAAAGHVMNGFQRLGNYTWNRKKPVSKDYVHILAVKSAEFKENNMIIGRSLSFGLLLFCIGLCLTLIYIILW